MSTPLALFGKTEYGLFDFSVVLDSSLISLACEEFVLEWSKFLSYALGVSLKTLLPSALA